MKQSIPLCVDLDGTLCQGDTLAYAYLKLLRSEPRRALVALGTLPEGRAQFKQEVSKHLDLDSRHLPWRADFVEWLKEQSGQGRRLVLCTGADARIAGMVADHFGFFSEVLSSDGDTNLTGERKRAALEARYGSKSFDYAGNDQQDLKVWPAARQCVVVGARPALVEQVKKLGMVERSFAGSGFETGRWLRAMRVHQWVKNLLILLPLALAHRLDPGLVSNALLAFAAFSLCASSGYIVNDLLDMESDQRHPNKRRRPFAAGELSSASGGIAAGLLLAGSLVLGVLVNWAFAAILVLYYVLTLTYSVFLKRIPVVDVMALAGLYTLRLIAGGIATQLQLSFWLLAFSMFLFLSLGVVKRYAEMRQLKQANGSSAHGRGYHVDDLPLLGSMGLSAGYGAVLVLALYVNSPDSQALYGRPEWLWLLCPVLLFWISRVWIKTHRGLMHDDPIVFALRDRPSLWLLLLSALIVLAATF